jgi:hypothetical protein
MDRPRIFVSYSHSAKNDPAWVRSFTSALRRAGADVWSDQQIPPGEDWSDALAKALRKSDVIVFVLSRENLQGPNLMFELGAALAMNKLVVPVVATEVMPSDIPYPLRVRQWLRQEEPEEAAREVLEVTKVH